MSLNKVNLGAVVQIVMGQAPASEDCNKEGRGIPFVKVGEFGDERPIIREWTTDPKKLAKRTDVLLCVVGATCGKINLGEDCAIGRSVAAIRPIENKILQSYLHYFMKGKVEEMRVGSKGAAQTVISKDMINAVKIPLPSIDEQKRIVEILDEAFEGIDAAIANTETNLANARELFASYLSNIFVNKNPDWEEATLGKIYDVRDGTHDSPKYQTDGYPLITSKNLKSEGLSFEKISYISKEDYQDICKRSEVHKGDVLFAMIGTIGNPTVVEVEPNFAIKNVALFKVNNHRTRL